MIVLLASFAIYSIADLAAPAFVNGYVKGTASFYCILLAASLLMVSVEMPLLYEFGYARSRTIIYVIKFLLFFLTLKVMGKDVMISFVYSSNVIVAILLFASLLVFLLAIFLSIRIYERKDL